MILRHHYGETDWITETRARETNWKHQDQEKLRHQLGEAGYSTLSSHWMICARHGKSRYSENAVHMLFGSLASVTQPGCIHNAPLQEWAPEGGMNAQFWGICIICGK
jgi:hypothetical protein